MESRYSVDYARLLISATPFYGRAVEASRHSSLGLIRQMVLRLDRSLWRGTIFGLIGVGGRP
jgi:hypothetical protein